MRKSTFTYLVAVMLLAGAYSGSCLALGQLRSMGPLSGTMTSNTTTDTLIAEASLAAMFI